jgi:hypothetical protein
MILTDFWWFQSAFRRFQSNFWWFLPTFRWFQSAFFDDFKRPFDDFNRLFETFCTVRRTQEFFSQKKTENAIQDWGSVCERKKWVGRQWNKKLEVVLCFNVPTFSMFVYMLNHTVINIQQFVKMYLTFIESN